MKLIKTLILIFILNIIVYPQIYWGKYEFNPVLTTGNPGFWDGALVYAPSVVNDGEGYKMYYAGFDGSNYQIGLATSSDKINWEKFDIVPVLETGAGWESRFVTQPSVLFNNGIYQMWYTGWSGGGAENLKIGYAISNNGINWDKYDFNPVLTPSTIGNWDPIGISGPSVVETDGTYYMWFTGYSSSNSAAIGLATSSDGINWDWYQGNPVLEGNPAGWDKNVSGCKVINLGTDFLMWYTGFDGDTSRIGYAYSYNGIDWNKYSGNPVLNTGPKNWDHFAVDEPEVLLDTYYFEMWYSGFDNLNHSQIGYAEELNIGVGEEKISPDGFQLFQNYPNPFNPVTRIQYSVGSQQFVTLKIYDLLGREISTLVNEEKPAGEYEVVFDSKGLISQTLTSGIYFYRLKAGSFVETKMMILLK